MGDPKYFGFLVENEDGSIEVNSNEEKYNFDDYEDTSTEAEDEYEAEED